MARAKRARKTSESEENVVQNENSGYEQFREQRIKENMERMQKLGILDLSHNLKKSHTKPKPKPKPTPRNPSDKRTHNPLPLSGSPRRSTRLKTLTPVSYSEDHPKRKRGSLRNTEICILEGSQPEIYTEEHDKLLGDCKMSWTLSVDGYGKDGERIYDPVNGETCHQCRQKTLGLRTHCSQCTLVQGQFCGDCLYMRYGENVNEANQNPDWICPVCRGICNCSLCRKGKGWMPTGNLYRKVLKLGFKSVAHYLIQTHRSQSNLEDSGTETLASPEASQPSELLDADKSPDEVSKPQLYDSKDVKMEEDEVQCFDTNHADINRAYNKGDDDVDTNDELNEKGEDVSEECQQF